MRRALLQALALSLAVLIAPAAQAKDNAKAKDAGAGAAPQLDYAAVSRALTEVDSADRRGELGDELTYAQAAEARPDDLVAQFLSYAAQPEQEARWQGYHQLSLDHPQLALPWVGMARVYLAWRTWDQAEKAIAAALQRDPRCWLAVRLRAELNEARKQPEKAQADYQEVLKSDPRNPEAHFGLARLARARGDAEEAHAQAAAALEEARSLPGAWAILGQLAEELGEPATAIDFWKGAVEQAPGDREARAALARLLAAQGDHGGAAAQWEAIVQLKESPEALAALAAEAHAAGRPEAEQGAAERLAKLHPSPEQWKRVAALRLGAGDTEGAERAYRRVLDGSPRDPEANLGVGRVLLARGDAVRAVEALRASGDPGKADLAALERRLELEKLARPDVTALQRAVQGHVDKVYRARLAATPTLSGTLRVRVTVDGAGAATLVEVLEDSVHDGDVRACAYWNLRDATYPQQKPGRYSFVFNFKR